MGLKGAPLDERLRLFADEVGDAGPVAAVGHGTRGGATADSGVRTVRAPTGIGWVQPAEMTIRCGAGTPVDEVDAALAEHGQCVAFPPGGTVGGALAVGRSDVRRLGWGPIRDTLLQTHYVSAAGELVKAGGPTVKNVSGFDLCRLLVGSYGTLGFLGDVILRTRPRPIHERWFRTERDPWDVLADLYRPTAVLWDGTTCWALLDGHPVDVEERAAAAGLIPVEGPPTLPDAARWSLPAAALAELSRHEPGSFVAEIGVGIVHHTRPAPSTTPDPAAIELHRRIKREFDPTARLNPGVSVLP